MRLGLGLGLVRLGKAIASFVRDGLKLYYPFKDNSPDLLLDGSTSFDGTNDYIDLPMAFSNTVHTISGWFKLDNVSGNRTLFCGRDGNDDGIRVLLNTSQIAYQINTDDELSGTGSISANVWTHVACTYDGTTQSIYLNGLLSASQSISRTISTTQTAKIGRTAYGGSNYMLGMLANIGLWDRALSASEVESIYWRGSHSELKDTELTNLISWYNLSSAGLGAEVISNGTMETASSLGGYSSFPEDWTASYGTLSVQERSSAQAFAGTHSLLFKTNASSRSGVAQNFSVTGSVSYRLEFYVYGVTGNTIQITHQTGSGTASTLEGGGTFLDYEQSVRIGEWEKITFNFTTSGSGTVTGTVLQLGSNVSGNSYYIDNVSLKRIGAGAPDSQGNNDGTIEGATTNSDSYSGESPFKPRIQDKAHPKMAVQLADGSTSFDGTDDFINLPTSSAPSGNEITISFWEKTSAIHQNKLIEGLDSSGNTQLNIHLHYSNGQSYWDAGHDGSSKDRINTTNPSGVLGQWNHWAYTKNASTGIMAVYLNGSLFMSGTGKTKTIGSLSGGSLRIAGKTSFFYEGSLANFAFFSSALTQTQIQELMFTEKYSGLSADLKTNLVSWYDMGSSSNPHNDLQGSNHGTNNGGTVNTGYTHSPHGVVDPLNFGEVYSGRALDFDGTNSYVDCGDGTSLDITSNLSMSFWVKFDSGSATQFLIGRDDDVNRNFELGIGSNKLFWNIYSGGVAKGGSGLGSTLSDNIWYHISATYDGSNLKTYVNGSLNSTNSGTGAIDNDNVSFTIGAREGGMDRHFNGKMSSVKVFNISLTQDQVRQLYNKPEMVLATGVSASNLKLDLPMQEKAGTIVYDGSGNQNHGTITGATFVSGQEYGYQASLVRSNTPIIFGGSNDFVSCGNIGIRSYPFTYSAWFRTNGTTKNTICALADADQNVKFYQFLIADTGVARINARNTADDFCDSSGTYNDGKWHHGVAVFASATDRKIYIDGVADGSDTSSVAFDSGVDEFSIGVLNRSSKADYYDDDINEVAVWDVALDADAVSALYNSGVPLLPTSDSGNYDNSDSLMGYWRNDGKPTWTDRANTGYASFDDSDDQITLSDSSALTFGTTDFTASAWVYVNDLDNKLGVLGSETNGFGLFVETDGTISSTKTNIVGESKSSGTVSVKNWHHIAYTRVYSTGGTSSLGTYYINGVASGTTIDNNNYTVVSKYIGRIQDANRFDGKIAGCNYFSIPLTASEISELYTIGKRTSISGHSQFSNCVGSWLMGAGTGDTESTIQDQTSNNNDGTVSGASIIGYNDGTVSGSPVKILIPEGSTEGRDNQGYYLSDTTKISNGIRLHGTEYILVDSSEALAQIFDGGGSVEGWIKPQSDGGGNAGRIIDKDTGSGWFLFVENESSSSVRLQFNVRFSTTDGAWQMNNNSVPINQWSHFVLTYNGSSTSNNPIIYINSSSEALTEVSTPVGSLKDDTSEDIYIGTEDGSPANGFEGLIDEIRIYDKILSADEVTKNYNNGKTSHQ